TLRCTHDLYSLTRRPPCYTRFPYTTLFRSPARQLRVRCSGRGRNATRPPSPPRRWKKRASRETFDVGLRLSPRPAPVRRPRPPRSEEHTSELQSRENLVCRLLLEKKKSTNT